MTNRKTRITFAAAFAVSGALTIAACIGDDPARDRDDPVTPDGGGTDTSVAADVVAPTVDASPEASPILDATVDLDDADAADAAVDADAADAAVDAGVDAAVDAGVDAGPVADGGPLAWYAGDLTSNGGVVWKDSSGRGHDLTPLDVPPTVVVSGGKNVAKFTAPAEPAVSCLRNTGLVVPAARSMYAVALLTRWLGPGKTFDSTLLGFGGKEAGIATIVRAGPSPRWISGNVEFGYTTSALADINVVKLFAVRDDGSNALEFTVTGNTNILTGTYFGAATTGGVYVGCEPGSPSKQWDGTVAEIMIFGRRLDDTEHQATINALKTKWSIP